MREDIAEIIYESTDVVNKTISELVRNKSQGETLIILQLVNIMAEKNLEGMFENTDEEDKELFQKIRNIVYKSTRFKKNEL